MIYNLKYWLGIATDRGIMMRTQVASAQRMVNFALKALIIAAILTYVLSVWDDLTEGIIAAVIGAIAVVGSIYADRRAGKQMAAGFTYYLWKYVPTIILILVPLASYLFGEDGDKTWREIIEDVQILLTFVVPALLLFIADYKLKTVLQAPSGIAEG